MGALIMALLEHPEHVTEVTGALRDTRHKVLVVHSFSEALNYLRTRKIDLIISDVHLENGGNVFDFLIWTRNNPQLQSVPFVLLSLHPTKLAKYLADGVSIAARSLGADRYISMDVFDPVAFRNDIDELLRDYSFPEDSKFQYPFPTQDILESRSAQTNRPPEQV